MNQRQAMNSAHPEYLGWQMDWPLYVKSPVLRTSNKVFARGDYFPWAEMQLDPHKVFSLYQTGIVHHDARKATEEGHGDRLGEINGRDLTSLVGLLNNDLKKKHTATEEEFKRKRCRQSSIPDTQRRFIRQFLSKNPYMTDYFLETREMYLKKPVEKKEEE